MIPRFKPYIGFEELRAIFKIQAGRVPLFEKNFARVFNAVDAVAFPYGRSAHWAFFKAIGLYNSEVIMPAYTCSVVAHAVSLSDNVPRFVDIDLDDYNANLDLIAEAVNENTRAIIATHTFGHPQNLDRLEAIVKKGEARYGHKIWLIQDCCHSFGAEWNGRMVGTSGDVAVYAFNISKMITSIFGGMLTFQDEELANRVRNYRDQNFSKAAWTKTLTRRLYFLLIYIAFNNRIYKITKWLQTNTKFLHRWTQAYHLDDKIHFPPDYLDLMLDVEAAVGIEQLKKYDHIIEHRKLMARRYNHELACKVGWQLPPIINGATYSHYVVRVPDRASVIKKYEKLGLELGSLIQYSIPELNCYGYHSTSFPNSSLASKSLVNFTVSISQ